MKFISFASTLLFAATESVRHASASSALRVLYNADGSIKKEKVVDFEEKFEIGVNRGANDSLGRNLVTRGLSDGDRQANVWNVINSMDSYKSGRIFTESGGRPRFSSFHYLVVPVRWSDENSADMNIANIQTAMDKVVKNFSNQSWNRFNLTYEILPQTRLIDWSTGNNRFWGVKNSLDGIVKSSGYTKGQNYDGILMIFNPSRGGAYNWAGGKAEMNGAYATASYPVHYDIVRHEMGHNFNHYHHMHYHYEYRNSRPHPPEMTDGFDMMSGGNQYERSDFGVASKHYYNWVSDNNIVSMQPEGGTQECPTCMRSGTFTLKSFDNWLDEPNESDLLGIRIPVMTLYDSEWETQNVYSYWLSYRTGVDGFLSEGLSVHVAWFELQKSTMTGAWFDSMNYDAFGYSDNKADSVVIAKTCYHISPAGYLSDRDIVAANMVQPIVCVESIDKGKSITVTVDFIDPNNKPTSNKPNLSVIHSPCKADVFTANSSDDNLLHVTGLGKSGSMQLSVASSTGSTYTFFYDDYPIAPLSFNAPPSYGSTKRLFSETQRSSSLSYKALFGEVYTYIPPWAGNGVTTISISCQSSSCLANEYKANGYCNKCPPNHRSPPSSTSINSCSPCPTGTRLAHPLATYCSAGGYANPGPTPTIPAPSPVAPTSPTATLSPTFQCIGNEIGTDTFLLMFAGTNPILRTCTWLAMQPEFKRINICRKTIVSGQNQPANKVCLKSCKKCDRNVPVPLPTQPTNSVPSPTPPTTPTTPKLPSNPFPSPLSPTPPTPPTPPMPTPVVPTTPTSKSKCNESGSDTFLLMFAGPNPIIRTCTWLAEQSVSKKGNICGKTITSGDIQPANKVCLKACDMCDGNGDFKPTLPPSLPTPPSVPPPSEVLPPSVNCFESSKASFLSMFGHDGRSVARNCAWLQLQPSWKIRNFCQKTITSDNLLPAGQVCLSTCGNCVCSDPKDGRFYLKLKSLPNGATRVVRKTCAWLQSQGVTRRNNLCSRSQSYNKWGPAKNVCLETCGLCG